MGEGGIPRPPSPILLPEFPLVPGCRLDWLFPPEMSVRQQHDRGHDQEQRYRTQNEPGERGAEIRLLLCRHHLAPASLDTLAFVTVSFWAILGTTSMPSTTFPNTVCTPFRCLVFCSLSTMKNWLPPVFLPACAIDSAPTSCLYGLPWVSQSIL